MTSYQKLKKAVEMLNEEINILVLEPDSQAALMIKMRTKFRRDIENQIMAGNPTKPESKLK